MSSPDYKRGYSRGYSTGTRNIAEVRKQYADALDAFRERAERAEAGLGLGLCRACQHWRRESQAAWGTCTLAESILSWPWPWRGDDNKAIHTQENFGCVRFQGPVAQRIERGNSTSDVAGSSPAGAASSTEIE